MFLSHLDYVSNYRITEQEGIYVLEELYYQSSKPFSPPKFHNIELTNCSTLSLSDFPLHLYESTTLRKVRDLSLPTSKSTIEQLVGTWERTAPIPLVFSPLGQMKINDLNITAVDSVDGTESVESYFFTEEDTIVIEGIECQHKIHMPSDDVLILQYCDGSSGNHRLLYRRSE
jgi:hypothetical protein